MQVQGIRWYHKIVFKIFVNTAVVNSQKKFKNKKLQFSHQPVQGGAIMSFTQTAAKQIREKKHTLSHKEERTRDVRKRRKKCKSCYEKYMRERIGVLATKNLKLLSIVCKKCN